MSTKSKRFIIILLLNLITFISIFDYFTGYELSFSIFYLIPIALASFYSSRKIGIIASVLSALAWVLIEIISEHEYSNDLILFWNTLVRLFFFIITAYQIQLLKMLMVRQEAFARTDGLTGLLNGFGFRESAVTLFNVAERHKHSIVLGYLDLDDFKQVNDQHGHSEGDRVLKEFGGILLKRIRKSDIAGRIGGDEFVVCLTDTDYRGAKLFFENIHNMLEILSKENNWNVGCSIGAVVFDKLITGFDKALTITDKVMYEIKTSGKNRIKVKNIQEVDVSVYLS